MSDEKLNIDEYLIYIYFIAKPIRDSLNRIGATKVNDTNENQ